MKILAERPGVIILMILLLLCLTIFPTLSSVYADDKPNILWLVAEDLSPDLGCYGDTYSTTPNIDRLATQGLRYVNCWSNAPVCAPARTTLLMGMFPPSLGAHHMRSEVPIPADFKPYPQLLREQGYFTTNNAKTDYNVTVDLKKLWNQNGKQAHWKNRQPDQPFFAVFNFEITHESQIRNKNTLAENRRHDPAKSPIPAYHPDTPEVRKDWAQYYDRITQLDDQIKQRLNELDEAGLTEETIVFFYGDNGCGMPRSKRTVIQTGLNVPLIIRIPEKYKHLAPKEYAAGGTSDRLVSFVDFAPTLLSLIGEQTPKNMHGKAFAGQYDAGKQRYIFGFRGRMDERHDGSRSVRDERYVLVINLYPHIPFGARNDYMFQTPTTQVWKKLYDERELLPKQSFFFEMKPPFELYDLQNDPDQVDNLANLSDYHQFIQRYLFDVLLKHMRETRDIGFLPEALFWERTQGDTPYEVGHDPKRYDFDMLVNTWSQFVAHAHAVAEDVSHSTVDRENSTREKLRYKKIEIASMDEAERYWYAIGRLYLLAQTARRDGAKPTEKTKQRFERLRPVLESLADDRHPVVRIPAAEALGRYGTEKDVEKAQEILLNIIADRSEWYHYRANLALNSLDSFASRITDSEFAGKLKSATESMSPFPKRIAPAYFGRLTENILH